MKSLKTDLTFISTLVLVAVLSASRLVVAASDSPITVTDAWVRSVPPSAETTAAYFLIKNTTEKEVSLIGAKSPLAKTLELHNHIHKDGMMKMEQVSSISIAPKGEVKLQPAGLHVMLFGLTPEFKNTKEVPITLTFSDKKTITIKATIK